MRENILKVQPPTPHSMQALVNIDQRLQLLVNQIKRYEQEEDAGSVARSACGPENLTYFVNGAPMKTDRGSVTPGQYLPQQPQTKVWVPEGSRVIFLGGTRVLFEIVP
jgi:hypothetical protein